MTCGKFLGIALESDGLYVLAFPLSDLVINFQRRLDLFLTEFCVTYDFPRFYSSVFE